MQAISIILILFAIIYTFKTFESTNNVEIIVSGLCVVAFSILSIIAQYLENIS